jgi:hypothetical protein
MNINEIEKADIRKYQSSFRTVRLNFFIKDTNLSFIEQKIKHAFKHVSLFYIIHDENGDIVCANHKKYSCHNAQNFKNEFLKAINHKFNILRESYSRKFYITFSIVECDVEYKVYKNYQLIKNLDILFFNMNEKLVKIEWLDKSLKFILKYYTIIFSMVTVLFVHSIFKIFDFLPSATISLETVLFEIVEYFIMIGTVVISLISFMIVSLWVISLFSKVFSKKTQLRYSTYLPNMAYQELSQIIAIVSFSFLTIVTIIPAYLNNGGLASFIIQSYLGDVQKPSPKEIYSSNSSKVVLYLGEDVNFMYLDAIDVNRLIYEKPQVVKEVCMGEEKPYVNFMMPLIQNDILDNRVYKTVRSKDVHMTLRSVSSQKAFCYVKYPFFLKSKKSNKIILLMGRKNNDSKKDQYFYFSQETINKYISSDKLCNKKGDFISNLMKLKNINKEEFQEITIKNFKEDVIELNSSVLCKK